MARKLAIKKADFICERVGGKQGFFKLRSGECRRARKSKMKID